MGVCAKCKLKPETEEEVVLSAILSEYLLDKKSLSSAAKSKFHRNPKKIDKFAYDLIADFLREEGLLPVHWREAQSLGLPLVLSSTSLQLCPSSSEPLESGLSSLHRPVSGPSSKDSRP